MTNLRGLFLGALVVFCGVFGLATPAFADGDSPNAPDPAIPDTVYIPATINTTAGGAVAIPINLWNDEKVAGGTLGFKWNSVDFSVDSVSYAGSRFANAEIKNSKIDNANRLVLTGFSVIFAAPMSAGFGLWGTIWGHTLGGSADQCIIIDSSFVPPAGPFVLVSPPPAPGQAQVVFTPQFQGGQIIVGAGCPANQPPVLASIGAKSINEGLVLNFGVSSTDPEAGPITLTAADLPVGATFNDQGDGTGSFSWPTNFTNAGSYQVTFIASDNGDLADSELVNITINNVNRPPVLAAIGAKSVAENALISFNVSATDPDGQGVTFNATPLPTGATFLDNGNGTGTFNWTPGFTQSGNYPITFSTSDGSLGDNEIVIVTVTNVNRPPVLAAIGSKGVNENALLSFNVSATDPDGTPVSFSAAVLPSGSNFVDNLNGTGTFSWTPSFTQAGSYPVTFTVSDGSLSDDEAVTITVTNVNRPPVLAAIGGKSVDEGSLLSFLVSGSDPDGGALTLGATPLPTGAGFVDNGNGTGTFSWTPADGQNGPHQLTFSVSDGSLGDNELVTITVNDLVGNTPPVLAAIGPRAVDEGLPMSFGVSATDNEGDPLTLTAAPLPTGASFVDHGDGTGTFSWTPNFTQAGPYQVLFGVSDGGAADNELVTITVTNVNRPPVLAAIGGKNVDEGQLLSFLLTGTDPDGQALTFSSVGLPTGASLINNGNGTASFSWTPSFSQSGSHPVTFKVSDGSLVDTEFVEIVVTDVTLGSFSLAPDSLFFLVDSASGFSDSQMVAFNSSFDPANQVLRTSDFPSFVSGPDGPFEANQSRGFRVNAGDLPPGTYCGEVNYSLEILGLPQTLKICMQVKTAAPLPSSMRLSDSVFVFNATAGQSFIGGDSLQITNLGPGPNFSWTISQVECIEITPSHDTLYPFSPDWSSVAPTGGTTPGHSFISVDNEGLSAGQFICRYMVEGTLNVNNSPQFFTVILNNTEVVEQKCLALSGEEFCWTVVKGHPFDTCHSVQVTNSCGSTPIGWALTIASCYYRPQGSNDSILLPIIGPLGDSIVFHNGSIQPTSGTTPGNIDFCVNNDGLNLGQYSCRFNVTGNEGTENSPQSFMVCLNVLPDTDLVISGDTMWVATVPATPGSSVAVPVNLINFDPLCGLNIPLGWESSEVYLDSISFEGTRLEGLSKTEVDINNLSRQAHIMFNAINFALPAGEGPIANMHFTVFSGISDAGFVPIDISGVDVYGPLSEDNCDALQIPVFYSGGIVIDSSANFTCGRVIDTAGNEIPGAVVQVWDNFPQGSSFASTVTDELGDFKFDQLYVIPYTLYAYAEGYYPNTVDDLNFGSVGIDIVLTPVSQPKPSNEWVNFYCDHNLYQGVPLPIGSVVDAYDPDGDHVGTFMVTEAGKYGFMQTYRDDFTTPEDDGADPGDIISFYINGLPAQVEGGPFTWTAMGESYEACLNSSVTQARECCLRPGWNLISWNVNTDVDDIETIFGSIMSKVDVILSFEEVGLTYDPALPQFSTLHNADHLHGYWVRITGDDSCTTLNLEGLPVLVNTPVHLEAGWNLVSYLPGVTLPTPAALVSQENNLRIALGYHDGAVTYDPSLPEFSTLDEMLDCHGYWLKVYSDANLVYPGYGQPASIEPTPINEPGVLAKLGVAGELFPSANWQDIYSANLRVNGEIVSAGASIRVVSASGQLVGYGVTSAAGELRFTPVYAAMDAGEKGIKSGEAFSLVINDVSTLETFTFNERGSRLEIGALTAKESGSTLPTQYNLEQNYPNPFNPDTKIRFSLPEAKTVSLEIYNVLGEKVTTLVNGFVEAGETTVTWNGVDDHGRVVSSGVYFYRLKAGEFTQTRKMALMK